ncbi:DedA family protein [Brevibacterium album]|uniref:DedA family protein n=1 Tax=Brevibacterium album TaxID=417948 RepID=UPI0012EBEA80|nr:VTT domain-containing protein [Brevibacterium album]
MSAALESVLESAGPLSYLLAALLAALPFGPGEATALTGGLLTTGPALDARIMVPVLALGVFLGDLAVFLTVRRAVPGVLRRWLPRASAALSVRRGSEPASATPASTEPAGCRAEGGGFDGCRTEGGDPHASGDRRAPRWVHFAVLGARFVPGGRTPATALAAASALELRRYLGLSAVSAGLWALVWVSAGRALGAAGTPLGPLLLSAVLVLAVLTAGIHAHRRRLARTAAASGSAIAEAASAATRAAGENARAEGTNHLTARAVPRTAGTRPTDTDHHLTSPRKDTSWTPF